MQQEIKVLVAQKNLESKILGVIPLIMVALLSYSSPDYMAPLYRLGTGSVVMTIALILIVFSYWVTKRIINIQV